MDKMSLLSILMVSIPEEILSIYLCFLITGEKTHLFLDDTINIIRLTVAVFLMVTSTVIMRMLLPNVVLLFLINIIVISVIFKFTYRMKWSKSAINALILYGVLISIEIICTPIFSSFTGVGIDQVLNSDKWRIIFSIPERGIQLFLIISLWNWNKVLFNIKEYKEVRGAFIIFMVILLSIEVVFLLIFLSNPTLLHNQVKWLYIGGFGLFAVLNFSLFRLLSVFINAIVKKDLNDYINSKKEAKKKFELIEALLEKNEIEKAKSLCKSCKN